MMKRLEDFQYRLLPKVLSDNFSSAQGRPTLQVGPLPPERFDGYTLELDRFFGYKLGIANLDSEMDITSIHTLGPDSNSARGLNAFLEIDLPVNKNWTILQGLFIPNLGNKNVYLAKISVTDPQGAHIDCYTPTEQIDIPINEAIPHGQIFAVRSPRLQRLRKNKDYLFNQGKTGRNFGSENALMEVSDRLTDKSGDYKSVVVMTGFLQK